MKQTILRCVLIGTAAAWTAGALAQQPTTRPVTQPAAAQIGSLINQLGDENFRTRQLRQMDWHNNLNGCSHSRHVRPDGLWNQAAEKRNSGFNGIVTKTDGGARHPAATVRAPTGRAVSAPRFKFMMDNQKPNLLGSL